MHPSLTIPLLTNLTHHISPMVAEMGSGLPVYIHVWEGKQSGEDYWATRTCLNKYVYNMRFATQPYIYTGLQWDPPLFLLILCERSCWKLGRWLSSHIFISQLRRGASDSVPPDRQGLTDGEERRGEERRGEERRGEERRGKERKGKERKGKERKGKETFKGASEWRSRSLSLKWLLRMFSIIWWIWWKFSVKKNNKKNKHTHTDTL